VNHPLFLFAATLFVWVVGYFYFRWIAEMLRADTRRLYFWIGPFDKEWEFPAGSLRHLVNAAVHWFQIIISVVVGVPIALFFMVLMPCTFLWALWQMLAG
jgi:hypothetical protein